MSISLRLCKTCGTDSACIFPLFKINYFKYWLILILDWQTIVIHIYRVWYYVLMYLCILALLIKPINIFFTSLLFSLVILWNPLLVIWDGPDHAVLLTALKLLCNRSRNFHLCHIFYLLIIDRKQPKCPSVDEWMKKMWSKLNMEVHIWSPSHSGGKSGRITFTCWVKHNLDNTTRHSLKNKQQKRKKAVIQM